MNDRFPSVSDLIGVDKIFCGVQTIMTAHMFVALGAALAAYCWWYKSKQADETPTGQPPALRDTGEDPTEAKTKAAAIVAKQLALERDETNPECKGGSCDARAEELYAQRAESTGQHEYIARALEMDKTYSATEPIYFGGN